MLILRELTYDDLKNLNSMRNDTDIVSQLVSPFRFVNYETDRKWFESYMSSRNQNVRCVLCDNAEQSIPLAYAGLLDIDSISRSALFYIQIAREHQGKKYGTAATNLILQHGFNNLNLNRIELTVLEYNERAINLYEKTGFKKEGIKREAVYKNGKYENLVFMSILKNEFYVKPTMGV